MTDFFADNIASGVPVEPGQKPVRLRVKGAPPRESMAGIEGAPNQVPDASAPVPKASPFLDVYRRELTMSATSSTFSVYVMASVSFKDPKHAKDAELRKTKKSVKIYVKDDEGEDSEVARMKLLPGFEVVDVTRSPHGFLSVCAKLGEDDETEDYEVIK